MKINQHNLIKNILDNFPDFNESWEKHLEYWKDDPRTIGNDMSAFFNFISKKLEKDEIYDYQKVFNFIEDLLINSNELINNTVATMFLEDLINHSANGRYPSSRFVNYLGRISREICINWDQFTKLKTPGL